MISDAEVCVCVCARVCVRACVSECQSCWQNDHCRRGVFVGVFVGERVCACKINLNTTDTHSTTHIALD